VHGSELTALSAGWPGLWTKVGGILPTSPGHWLKAWVIGTGTELQDSPNPGTNPVPRPTAASSRHAHALGSSGGVFVWRRSHSGRLTSTLNHPSNSTERCPCGATAGGVGITGAGFGAGAHNLISHSPRSSTHPCRLQSIHWKRAKGADRWPLCQGRERAVLANNRGLLRAGRALSDSGRVAAAAAPRRGKPRRAGRAPPQQTPPSRRRGWRRRTGARGAAESSGALRCHGREGPDGAAAGNSGPV
jgi:hypothetical protein